MRHFQQFDEELQDSDQTISTSARHLRPRTRLSTVTDISHSTRNERSRPPRRQVASSAFFSDTTDDDVFQPIPGRLDLAMSDSNWSKSIANTRTPLHLSTGLRTDQESPWQPRHVAKLHVDALEFPQTRSVLW